MEVKKGTVWTVDKDITITVQEYAELQSGTILLFTLNIEGRIGTNYFGIVLNPFGNCQILSFQWFALFCYHLRWDEKRILKILLYLKKRGHGKNMMQIDINLRENNIGRIEEIFKGNIRHSFEYTSTNISHMKQYLIETHYGMFSKKGIEVNV